MRKLVITGSWRDWVSRSNLNRNRKRHIKKILLLLFAFSIQAAEADWTGTSLSIDEIESDWLFENSRRVSDTTRLNLHFEEKTANGIGVGANIGRLTTRISYTSGPQNTEKFDASYLGVFLRYPLPLGESIAFHNQIGYQYHAGSSIEGTLADQIAWRDLSWQIGISARFGNLRIMPFAVLSDISGDIDRENSTDTFENKEEVSTGVSLDLFLDKTSFVRFKFSTSGDDLFSLRFAREY